MLTRICAYLNEHFPGQYANIGWGEHWADDGISISSKVGNHTLVMADGNYATGEIEISHGEFRRS